MAYVFAAYTFRPYTWADYTLAGPGGPPPIPVFAEGAGEAISSGDAAASIYRTCEGAGYAIAGGVGQADDVAEMGVGTAVSSGDGRSILYIFARTDGVWPLVWTTENGSYPAQLENGDLWNNEYTSPWELSVSSGFATSVTAIATQGAGHATSEGLGAPAPYIGWGVAIASGQAESAIVLLLNGAGVAIASGEAEATIIGKIYYRAHGAGLAVASGYGLSINPLENGIVGDVAVTIDRVTLCTVDIELVSSLEVAMIGDRNG